MNISFHRLQLFRYKPGDAGIPDLPLPVDMTTAQQRAERALLRHAGDAKAHWHNRPHQARLLDSGGALLISFRLDGAGGVEAAGAWQDAVPECPRQTSMYGISAYALSCEADTPRDI